MYLAGSYCSTVNIAFYQCIGDILGLIRKSKWNDEFHDKWLIKMSKRFYSTSDIYILIHFDILVLTWIRLAKQ